MTGWISLQGCYSVGLNYIRLLLYSVQLIDYRFQRSISAIRQIAYSLLATFCYFLTGNFIDNLS